MRIVEISTETRARNKLTITANKEIVRIKFQHDLTLDQKYDVILYFAKVVHAAPMNEHTLRGSIQLDKMIKYGMTLYNEPQKNPISFDATGAIKKARSV